MYEDEVSHYLEMMKKTLSQPTFDFSKATSERVPRESGVYVIYDMSARALQQQIIYAGRTKNLRRRLLGDHKRGNIEGSQFRKALGQTLETSDEKEISRYIGKNCTFRFMVVESFEEAVRLEHFTTAILAPILNVKHKQWSNIPTHAC